MATFDDENLIRRAQAGDADAQNVLFAQARDYLMHAAIRLTRRSGAYEDIVQDALVRAFSHLDQFKFECRFSTWAYRIMHNVAVDHWRRAKTKPLSSFDEFESPTLHGDKVDGIVYVPDSSPYADQHRVLELNRAMERVELCTQSLSPAQRKIFLARHTSDKTMAELAREMGISEGLFKNTLHRAHVKLRRALEAKNVERTKKRRKSFRDDFPTTAGLHRSDLGTGTNLARTTTGLALVHSTGRSSTDLYPVWRQHQFEHSGLHVVGSAN